MDGLEQPQLRDGFSNEFAFLNILGEKMASNFYSNKQGTVWIISANNYFCLSNNALTKPT